MFLFYINIISGKTRTWISKNMYDFSEKHVRVFPETRTRIYENTYVFFQKMMEQQRAALEEQQRKAKGRNMRNITPKK